MHQCIKFILFWNDTLHVSDGLSVHHQGFKSVTYSNSCLLASKRTAVAVCDNLEPLMMDGKTIRNM